MTAMTDRVEVYTAITRVIHIPDAWSPMSKNSPFPKGD